MFPAWMDVRKTALVSELVDGQAAAELGLKPGGLGRHDIAGVGNVDELLHGHRVFRF